MGWIMLTYGYEYMAFWVSCKLEQLPEQLRDCQLMKEGNFTWG